MSGTVRDVHAQDGALDWLSLCIEIDLIGLLYLPVLMYTKVDFKLDRAAASQGIRAPKFDFGHEWLLRSDKPTTTATLYTAKGLKTFSTKYR